MINTNPMIQLRFRFHNAMLIFKKLHNAKLRILLYIYKQN